MKRYIYAILVLSSVGRVFCVWGEPVMPIMAGRDNLQVSQIKDIRDNGISYEAHKAMLDLHLRETYHGKQLEDFALPGPQELKIEHGNDAPSRRSEMFLQELQSLEISTESTWDIDVLGYGSHLGNRTLMMSILRALPTIISLHWRNEEFIPIEILDLLEADHPSCRLYYDLNFWAKDPSHPRPTRRDRKQQQQKEAGELQTGATQEQNKINQPLLREAVLGSTVLYSLKVDVINGGRTSHPWRMDLVLTILSTCPHLKELDITVEERGGCLVFDTHDPWGFDFTKSNATIAPLESLTIDGYRFHTKPDGQAWMEWETENPRPTILKPPWKYLPAPIIDYFGYPKIQSWGGIESSFVKRDTSSLPPGTKTNLDIWLERMDWTKLHTLKIKNPSDQELAKFGREVLSSIRSVLFSGYYADHHAILGFLGNTSSSLEEIQFDGINFCSIDEAVSTIVDHHCSTLQTLMFKHSQPSRTRSYSRQNWTPYRFPSTSFLNTTLLIQLRDSAPGLRTLDLDIYISQKWDYELLDTLTSFSELEDLTLRFETQALGNSEKELYDYEDEEFEYIADCADDERHEDRIALMAGLKAYLTKRKTGKPFRQLETWVGTELVTDFGDIG